MSKFYQLVPTEDPESRNVLKPSQRSSVLKPSRSSTTIGRGSTRDQIERFQEECKLRKSRRISRVSDNHQAPLYVEDVDEEEPEDTRPPVVRFGNMILVSVPFQVIMALAIVANAIIIGAETDMPDLDCWNIVENTFLAIFLVELVLRMLVQGPTKYFDSENPDIVWNIFDFCIVSLGLFDVVSALLLPQNDGAGGGVSTLFRIIRLLRILRIFRIVRFLKQLYMLVFGFGVAAQATGWVTMLAAILIYVCSIIVIRMVRSLPEDSDGFASLNPKFGGVTQSMLTLFELMLNPDLSEYHTVLGKEVGLTVFIVVFVIFGSFGMVALLTGVISESMFDNNRLRAEEERIEREEKRKMLSMLLEHFFKESGNVRLSDSGEARLTDLLKSVGKLNDLLTKYGYTFTLFDLELALEKADSNLSGEISQEEFTHSIIGLAEGVGATTMLEIHQTVSIIRHKINTIEQGMFQSSEKLDSVSDRLLEMMEKMSKSFPSRPLDAVADSRSPLMNHSPVASDALITEHKDRGVSNCFGTFFQASVDPQLSHKVDSCELLIKEVHRKLHELTMMVRYSLPQTQNSREHGAQFSGRGLSSEAKFEAPLDHYPFPLKIPDTPRTPRMPAEEKRSASGLSSYLWDASEVQ